MTEYITPLQIAMVLAMALIPITIDIWKEGKRNIYSGIFCLGLITLFILSIAFGSGFGSMQQFTGYVFILGCIGEVSFGFQLLCWSHIKNYLDRKNRYEPYE